LLEETDERYLGKDPRYLGVEAGKFPKAEALKNTAEWIGAVCVSFSRNRAKIGISSVSATTNGRYE
jgi:hypothetical protein